MHCLSRYPNKEHVENEYTNDKGLARVRPCTCHTRSLMDTMNSIQKCVNRFRHLVYYNIIRIPITTNLPFKHYKFYTKHYSTVMYLGEYSRQHLEQHRTAREKVAVHVQMSGYVCTLCTQPLLATCKCTVHWFLGMNKGSFNSPPSSWASSLPCPSVYCSLPSRRSLPPLLVSVSNLFYVLFDHPSSTSEQKLHPFLTNHKHMP